MLALFFNKAGRTNINAMKKLIACLALAFAGTAAWAQDTPAPNNYNVSIGPSIGFGHAFQTPYHSDFFPSWNAGVTAIYGPVEWWGLGVDVRYSVEGAKTMVEGTERTMRLSYIRIPVKFIGFFGDYTDAFRPKVGLGPSFGFLMDQEDTYNVKANPFDVGVQGLLGFNYRLYRATWLNVDLNYYQGLTDVRQHTGTTELNGNLFLNAGVAFGL